MSFWEGFLYDRVLPVILPFNGPPQGESPGESFIELKHGLSVPMCHTDHATEGDIRHGAFLDLRQMTRVFYVVTRVRNEWNGCNERSDLTVPKWQ